MSSNKEKQPPKDIFTELFDLCFQVLFELIELVISLVFKFLKFLFSTGYVEIKKKNPDIKAFKAIDYISDVLDSSDKDIISEKTLAKSEQTNSTESIGYDVLGKEDFSFNRYKSSVPISVIIGPPGWGKTVLLLNLIDKDLYNDIPYIVIDPKASAKSKESFIKVSRNRNKEPLVFEFGSDLRFNPLSGLDSAQVVESIFRAFPNTHEYYGPRSKELVLDIVNVQKLLKKRVSFWTIYIDLEKISEKDRNFQMETQAIRSNLKLLLDSDFGPLFQDRDNNTYTIDKIRSENKCIYFSLPALAYNQLAASVAKVLITAIMNHSYRMMNEDRCDSAKNLSVYIDEAGDFLFRDFKSLASQCREAKVNLTIATQTISDLEEISPNFLQQIKAYTDNFWVFKVSDPTDAEKMARYIGTKTTTKETKQLQDGEESGVGSEREKESFIVHTNILKNIPRYKAILKTGDSKIVKVINIRNIENVLSLDSFEDLKTSEETKPVFSIEPRKIKTSQEYFPTHTRR